MKRNLILLGATALFMLSFTAKPPKPNAEPAVTINPVITSNLQKGHPGEALISKSDCIGCHKKDSQLIGPAYKDIAKKYANNEKNIALLAKKIIEGGTGVWGQIPMTPHPKVSTADAKVMVKYIMTLKSAAKK